MIMRFLFLVCLCNGLHWQRWSRLDHGGWWFWCVLGFNLPVFYLVFLHQCSWVKLVCNVLCILVLSKTFIMKGCCILSKAFLASNEIIMWFLFFSLFIWWITSTDFVCWTIPASLGWSWLDHGGWWFWCVFGFNLLVFDWVLLCQCSWVRLVCNSPSQ